MLAKKQSRPERRGIVLVLVLAMLGLLALIGVTFATFSGQSRINARNFAQSLIQPQDDELMDFALSQLINDTGDPRSVIRGHSMARDMYGTGSTSNGYLPLNPSTGLPFYILDIVPITGTTNGYLLTTNIAQNDPNFYGFNFTRWIMHVAYAGPLTVTGTVNITGTGTVNQTFEIIADSGFNPTSTAFRTFNVFIVPTDAGGSSITNGEATALNNPTVAANFPTGFLTRTPGAYLFNAIANGTNTALNTNFPFQLDGRWLHAFNGPGMGANAVYGNFRYNGVPLSGTLAMQNATSNFPGNPNSWAMDEDYDACDLENWFLAIQSADGQVMIPSFHRPAIIRNDTAVNAPNPPTVNDWKNINPFAATNAVSASRRLGLANPPSAAVRAPLVQFPRPGAQPHDRPDHVRRRQRRRRRHRLGLARPRLPQSARLTRAALQAPLRVHGHRLERPDPVEYGRQPGGECSRHGGSTRINPRPNGQLRSRPLVASGQLAQRD